ncbi:glyoxalase/bleomycin resistance/dioxygenase family protein [Tamlana sp. 2_MG-2023]|uniref:VOC family protein n=1 Tax=unclassified Tamlana TaxID=2614803 RepID=UPI0026E393B6|nr:MULTISPECIES: glyoxalase/bleomycin resistance/dioxygenase family protein [unclassified Tamlana]MDO6761429.1 glyoxalase/bleomycin resistance/dioxygenase family protein [Tamlana sp. 2_MG-2023]MDO6792127.1 glyoxalase/bleomycin resistance/dioxygenase family protein [Tamlana sp. 1_MG-2023]
MEFDRTGIILYTIEYKKCVTFYEEVLELTKLFETEVLTCFEFGATYLLVELDLDYDGEALAESRIKTCLRMNVPNVKQLSDKLISKGVDVKYQEFSWGTIAKFFDPDGNLCAFKDSEKFEKQIEDFNVPK